MLRVRSLLLQVVQVPHVGLLAPPGGAAPPAFARPRMRLGAQWACAHARGRAPMHAPGTHNLPIRVARVVPARGATHDSRGDDVRVVSVAVTVVSDDFVRVVGVRELAVLPGGWQLLMSEVPLFGFSRGGMEPRRRKHVVETRGVSVVRSMATWKRETRCKATWKSRGGMAPRRRKDAL